MKKSKEILRAYSPSEVITLAKVLEDGLLDDYKPKHIIAAATLLEDVTDTTRPLLLTIGEAARAWGIQPQLIKELVRDNKLSPILICNSKWRFKYDDIDAIITEGRI